jgi:hypothetical protein
MSKGMEKRSSSLCLPDALGLGCGRKKPVCQPQTLVSQLRDQGLKMSLDTMAATELTYLLLELDRLTVLSKLL